MSPTTATGSSTAIIFGSFLTSSSVVLRICIHYFLVTGPSVAKCSSSNFQLGYPFFHRSESSIGRLHRVCTFFMTLSLHGSGSKDSYSSGTRDARCLCSFLSLSFDFFSSFFLFNFSTMSSNKQTNNLIFI